MMCIVFTHLSFTRINTPSTVLFYTAYSYIIGFSPLLFFFFPVSYWYHVNARPICNDLVTISSSRFKFELRLKLSVFNCQFHM